jgi:ABC-type oligopeptide transport system substrate-binding subunit
MSDGSTDASTGTTDQQNPTQGQEPAKDAQQNGIDSLPEWVRKELAEARSDAAKYRTQLREAQAKAALHDAKNSEEVQAALKALQEANQKLERELVLERVTKGLPEELAGLVANMNGSEEELKTYAETLRKHVKVGDSRTAPPPDSLRGGLDPSSKPDTFDPAKAADMYLKGQL